MFEIDGIVLGTTPFNEHDSIVNIITKQQYFSFLAKGVLKIDSKNASLINLCNYSRFNVSKGKTGYSLRNGELLNSFQNAKKDLEKFFIAVACLLWIILLYVQRLQ